jgi:hypothetical protein
VRGESQKGKERKQRNLLRLKGNSTYSCSYESLKHIAHFICLKEKERKKANPVTSISQFIHHP